MILYNSPPSRAGTFVKTQQMKPVIAALAMLIYSGLSIKNKTMSPIESNKGIVRKLFEESLNKGKLELLPDLFAADFTGPQGEKGPVAFRMTIEPLLKAFPDIHYTIKYLVAENDKVAVSWTWQGTQTGQFRNIPATGKVISNEGMAVFVLKAGKIVSASTQTDRLGFLQGLGALPTDLTSLAPPQKGEINFIDKFFVPAGAIGEFHERTHINRRFIKTLHGFITDAAYERKDEDGNLICVTVARWSSLEAVSKAKEAVQEEYKKEGFDLMAMMMRLNITVDRGLYTMVDPE
jgi:steroid delta-isomerase-like uncharacterized protein